MMDHFDITQQIQTYQETLQRLLEQTRQQFAACPVFFSGAFPSLKEKEQLEKWILSLNTWYYQRFHQTFFPFYKEQMVQKLNEQLHLYQDQNTVEQNIMFVYKSYAQLYNQITQLLVQITQFQTHLQQFQMKVQTSSFKKVLKLYHQMQELEQKLQLLAQGLNHLSTWAQKVDVRFAFKQFPGHFSILPAIRSYTPTDRKSTRFLNELRLQIQLQLHFIQNLRKMLPENSSLCLNTIQNMKEESGSEISDKKIPLEIRHWYKQYFCVQQQMYLQNIENGFLAKSAARMDAASLERYEAWLKSLSVIIQELWLHPAAGNDFSLQEVIQYAMTPYNPNEDQKTLKTLLETIQAFLQTIDPGSHTDSAVFLQSAHPILQQARSFIQKWLQQALLGNGVSLLHPLQETNYILSTAEFTFDEIAESTEVHRPLAIQLDELIQVSGRYEQTFDEFRKILNRQLNPRQAERTLKSLPLKMERWTFHESETFPPDCIARMTEQNLSHLLPQNPSGLEGELFLFQVGSLCECVIPYVIGQEGGQE